MEKCDLTVAILSRSIDRSSFSFLDKLLWLLDRPKLKNLTPRNKTRGFFSRSPTSYAH